MTRKFTQLFAVAALFGGLTTSSVVLAGQAASSSPAARCEKMTVDCWQKDEEMERLSHNDGECMGQMKGAYRRMMQNSDNANPCVSGARCRDERD